MLPCFVADIILGGLMVMASELWDVYISRTGGTCDNLEPMMKRSGVDGRISGEQFVKIGILFF